MRKRTHLDKKFSQGNSNSDAYRASWERMFGQQPEPREQCADCGVEILGAHGHCTGVPGGFDDE